MLKVTSLELNLTTEQYQEYSVLHLHLNQSHYHTHWTKYGLQSAQHPKYSACHRHLYRQ